MRVLSAPFDDIPVLLPKTLELLFMMTELFLTVPALHVSVRPVRKPVISHRARSTNDMTRRLQM